MAPGCERSRQVVAGPGGCMQSRCGPCTGACAPSPMPRLLRPVPAFPVFCCPRPVARVLRPASCTPCPRARARVRVRVHVFRVLRPRPRVPRFASCAPRPRLPCSAPAPRTPHPRPRTLRPCPCPRLPRPAPRARARARVFCVPQTVARVPRPVSPPRTSGQVLPASASRRDEKKIGRLPRGTSRFCMHCSGASYSRLRIISPPW